MTKTLENKADILYNMLLTMVSIPNLVAFYLTKPLNYPIFQKNPKRNYYKK